ncbi:MAG: hypothetical protein J0G32_06355, partial [Alphaproteobacteria bacterium]|nr:hypothetical protein [Alphaproteobacteria bacterium]
DFLLGISDKSLVNTFVKSNKFNYFRIAAISNNTKLYQVLSKYTIDVLYQELISTHSMYIFEAMESNQKEMVDYLWDTFIIEHTPTQFARLLTELIKTINDARDAKGFSPMHLYQYLKKLMDSANDKDLDNLYEVRYVSDLKTIPVLDAAFSNLRIFHHILSKSDAQSIYMAEKHIKNRILNYGVTTAASLYFDNTYKIYSNPQLWTTYLRKIFHSNKKDLLKSTIVQKIEYALQKNHTLLLFPLVSIAKYLNVELSEKLTMQIHAQAYFLKQFEYHEILLASDLQKQGYSEKQIREYIAINKEQISNLACIANNMISYNDLIIDMNKNRQNTKSKSILGKRNREDKCIERSAKKLKTSSASFN